MQLTVKAKILMESNLISLSHVFRRQACSGVQLDSN